MSSCVRLTAHSCLRLMTAHSCLRLMTAHSCLRLMTAGSCLTEVGSPPPTPPSSRAQPGGVHCGSHGAVQAWCTLWLWRGSQPASPWATLRVGGATQCFLLVSLAEAKGECIAAVVSRSCARLVARCCCGEVRRLQVSRPS